jgi:hypothetical protein
MDSPKQNLLLTGTAKWVYLILSSVFASQLIPSIAPSVLSIGHRHITSEVARADFVDGMDIAVKVFGAAGSIAGSVGVLHERTKRGDTYTPVGLPGDNPPSN